MGYIYIYIYINRNISLYHTQSHRVPPEYSYPTKVRRP